MADSSTQSVCWGTVSLHRAHDSDLRRVPLFAYYYDYTVLIGRCSPFSTSSPAWASRWAITA